MRWGLAVGLLLMAALGAGCANSRDQGPSRSEAGGTGGRDGDLAGLPTLISGDSGVDRVRDGQGAATATTQAWLGHVRGYVRPCDEDAAADATRILLLLQHDADGRVLSGTVTFGDHLLPPPTDPQATYPPDSTWERDTCPRAYGVLGFEYPITEAQRHGNELRLAIDLGALWEGWCNLQPNHPVPDHLQDRLGTHACRPTDAIRFVLDDPSILSAESRCINHCRCTASRCVSRVYSFYSLRLRPGADRDLVGELMREEGWEQDASDVRLVRIQ